MSKWILEPGHTEAGFRARHMMVTHVDGYFKNIEGTVEWDRERPEEIGLQAEIDATGLWTGQPQRDAHLRSADFFDVENHPTITFVSTSAKQLSENHFSVTGDLCIRGITRPVTLDTLFHGEWPTAYWVQDRAGEWHDVGPVQRIGFSAKTRINRQDWDVSWQDHLDRGGVVVSDEVALTIEAEALNLEQFERAQQQERELAGDTGESSEEIAAQGQDAPPEEARG